MHENAIYDIIYAVVKNNGEKGKIMEIKCPVCGAPMENRRCGYCGYTEKEEVQTSALINNVSQQSEVITGQQTFVPDPGWNRMDILPGVSRKSKTVALLLCIFLGGFGAHKFYVGKVGMGVVYMCTAGLFGIGWLIDIILIATGSFKDEFDLPLRQ